MEDEKMQHWQIIGDLDTFKEGKRRQWGTSLKLILESTNSHCKINKMLLGKIIPPFTDTRKKPYTSFFFNCKDETKFKEIKEEIEKKNLSARLPISLEPFEETSLVIRLETCELLSNDLDELFTILDLDQEVIFFLKENLLFREFIENEKLLHDNLQQAFDHQNLPTTESMDKNNPVPFTPSYSSKAEQSKRLEIQSTVTPLPEEHEEKKKIANFNA